MHDQEIIFDRIGWRHGDARADILLIDGDPVQDIEVPRDYERNLAIIIKDGKVHKNTRQ